MIFFLCHLTLSMKAFFGKPIPDTDSEKGLQTIFWLEVDLWVLLFETTVRSYPFYTSTITLQNDANIKTKEKETFSIII